LSYTRIRHVESETQHTRHCRQCVRCCTVCIETAAICAPTRLLLSVNCRRMRLIRRVQSNVMFSSTRRQHSSQQRSQMYALDAALLLYRLLLCEAKPRSCIYFISDIISLSCVLCLFRQVQASNDASLLCFLYMFIFHVVALHPVYHRIILPPTSSCPFHSAF